MLCLAIWIACARAAQRAMVPPRVDCAPVAHAFKRGWFAENDEGQSASHISVIRRAANARQVASC